MENLPREIIFKIYNNLLNNQVKSEVKKDILNFSMTSKYARECLFLLDERKFKEIFKKSKIFYLKKLDSMTSHYLKLWKYDYFDIKYNDYEHISDELDEYVYLDCTNLGSLDENKKIGKIVRVDFSFSDLKNQDLSQFKYIKEFKLEECILDDYSFFKNAKKLNLQGSNVKDLECFSKLDKLDISYCKELDFATLKHLKNLKYLDLSYTDVEDISDISKIKFLSLRHCKKIKNFDLLGDQTYLNLSWTMVKDIKHLGNVKNLKLSSNNLSSVEGLYNVKELDISFNSEFTDLSPLKNIKILYCIRTKISYDLKRLKTLESIIN